MKKARSRSSVQWVLFLLGVVVLAVGSFAAPSQANLNASTQAATAPCPRGEPASCAFDPVTGWSYRDFVPVE